MPEFTVVTASTGKPTTFEYEMEALRPIGAEIVEVPATTEEEFLEAARNADAVIGGGVPMTRTVIEGLENCKVISLGSVGTDQVDVDAATERGIPVTNVPDTFIDEVADHTMALILGTYRRLTLMDDMVRGADGERGARICTSSRGSGDRPSASYRSGTWPAPSPREPRPLGSA